MKKYNSLLIYNKKMVINTLNIFVIKYTIFVKNLNTKS